MPKRELSAHEKEEIEKTKNWLRKRVSPERINKFLQYLRVVTGRSQRDVTDSLVEDNKETMDDLD